MTTKVLKFMQAAGAFAPFRFAHRGKALVLMYHRFSLGEHGPGLPVRVFREQLDYLTAHYQIVPLSYLATLLNSGRPVPPRTAVITIDDACRDAYAVAFPLLRARRIPATAFVVSGFIDRSVTLPDRPPEESAPIDWDQAREMDRTGVEIGSHTATHPILTNVDAERLHRELWDSRRRIEDELHRRVDLFCYPNGGLNAEVRQAVRRAGYMCAVTSEPGFNDDHSDVFALRRISTEPDLPRFIQSTSGFGDLKIRMLYGATAARQHA